MDVEDPELRAAAEKFVRGLGLDLNDENFADTPRRILAVYRELLHGMYSDAPTEVARMLDSTFSSDYDGIVSFANMDAIGVCPHHLLPVYYTVHAGYIPVGRVVGLSKVPRTVRLLAARPVMQEQFTQEVANALKQIRGAKGSIVIVRGYHSCVAIRGVRSGKVDHTTSAVRGVFDSDASAKEEFLELIKLGNGT